MGWGEGWVDVNGDVTLNVNVNGNVDVNVKVKVNVNVGATGGRRVEQGKGAGKQTQHGTEIIHLVVLSHFSVVYY